MFSFMSTQDLLVVIIALVSIWGLFRRTRNDAPLPPGPRGLPLIGNLIDMPSDKEWFTFARWGKEYGDIASVSVLGQRIVILNPAQVAIDMLDKKSSIFSDRPVLVMAGELVGWKKVLGLTPYGARFRDYRRRAYQLFGNNAAMKQFLPLEELETRRFLTRLLAKPEDLSAHIRKTTGAISLLIIYGYEIQKEEDLFVELAEQTMYQFSLSMASRRFLVNLIPCLRYILDWFPGAEFQRITKSWASTRSDMVEKPYEYSTGEARTSFTSKQLDACTSAEGEVNIKWLSASLDSSGVDTTAASIYAFFKAMILFPEVQVKAQAEIDAVVGNDRLPGFDDRQRLPYINALVLEVSRWHAVTPTGVPHRVTEDDVHSGYFIPKGSIHYRNMLHDPTVYDQPFGFKAKRFIRTEIKEPEFDPYEVSFGFGRRICPGRVLADASIFISCAMVLAVFNISKYCEDGIVFEPDTETPSGAVSHPTPFKCTIMPRNEKAFGLINEERFA
ncbi:related to cytochrome P450 CYP2 subfamily [Armillaria ostoyae]|uniref:Related to cytochrome P450 CYP2 subfamily n=1 Tax=Armillaria ostoyae TaxID=47428 RepID=A0A284R2U7_ARMOS|nr:related to cytochrome P450 CYP2 subfamily [Armillaria ostoyae]